MVYDSFEVGLALREQRIKQGLTIEELAFEVNRSKYHMNLIELGTRKMGMDLLFELVTVLHTDANSILGISSLKSNNNDISIDERLRKLDKNKCQYFTRVFMHMLDNIPACLGERTDTNYVRFGSDKADVTATFSYQEHSPEALWLKEHELDDESGEIHLRRVIFATGRSKAWKNGQFLTLKELYHSLYQSSGTLTEE